MNRVRFLIPNAITGTSFLLGFASILCTMSGAFEWAAWLIVWCVLLDVADGISARLLKAASEFGADFDSLSDLVAFGLAPALLTLNVIWVNETVAGSWWSILVCSVYALLAAIRLAIFNSQHDTRSRTFKGIPTTVCGALVSLTMILSIKYGAHQNFSDWPYYVSVFIFLLSVSMVSKIRFARPAMPSKRLLSILNMVNIAATYVCGFLRIFPEYLIFGLVLFIATGLFQGTAKRTSG